jgi:hypothetical protein
VRGYRRGADFVGKRVGAFACAAMLVTATFVGLTASPATAAATGAISGIVTAAASGAPLAKVCVSVHRLDIDSLQLRSVATAANGRYTLSALPAGPVNVQFADTGLCVGGAPGNYVGEYFNNEPSLRSATRVVITAGVTKANINAALAVGGSITGRVTAASGGAPLHHICVGAYIPGGDPLLVASASTTKTGTYKLNGVPARKVLVQFFTSGTCPGGVAANYVGQWFSGKLTSGTSDAVTVTAGGTLANVNAALVVGGTISGIVTSGGSGLYGICVAAYSAASPILVGSTGTLRNGRYALHGVPAGVVHVQFNSQGTCPGGIVQHYATQWYTHKNSFASANPVAIVAGRTTSNINASITPLKGSSKPGAPRSVHASKPSSRTVIVTWAAPAPNGGPAVSSYDVTSGAKTVRASASARKATFAGLAKGSYHFRVRAHNKIGAGAWSAASNTVRIS